jgi:hypothetical protein
MRNHQGRIVYRPGSRKSLRPLFERLETRCVLSGAPLLMPPSSLLGGYRPDSFGKPDSYGADNYGAEAKYGPATPDGKGLSPYEGNSQSPMGLSVGKPDNGYSPSVSDATVQSLGAGTHRIALTTDTFELILVSQAINGRYVFLTSTIITMPDTQTGNSGNDNASDGSHDVSKGSISHFGTTPISGLNSGTGVAADQSSHEASPVVTVEVPTTTSPVVQTQTTKLSTLAPLNPTATATPIQSNGDAYANRVVQQLAGAAISFDVPVAGNLLTAGMNVISNVQKLTANQKAGLVTIASTADAANWPVQKASLASMPLNLPGVEKALEKVMGELGHLGTTFTDWLDARHLTAAAITVSVITIGGGAAIYLRRRGNKQGLKRDDEEASSSWLFARLHSAPDAS